MHSFIEDPSAAFREVFSGRAEDLCCCGATEERPDGVAAARPPDRTELPLCSPGKSAGLLS